MSASKATISLFKSIAIAVILGAILGIGLYKPIDGWLHVNEVGDDEVMTGISDEDLSESLLTIDTTVHLLKKNFFRNLVDRDLLNAAIVGINLALSKHGKKELEIKPLKAEANTAELYHTFGTEYLRVVAAAAPKVAERVLTYAALDGIVAASGDVFTVAMRPTEYAALKEGLGDDDYGGVGMYLEADRHNNKQLTVIEPIENSPAADAGIRTGDCIMEIDGKPTANVDIEANTAAIRGKIGTTVKLTIKRKNLPEFTASLMRKSIHISSTKLKMLPNDVAYIRLRFFGATTAEEFAKDLEKATESGAKGLIVDVRNNGGGYVLAATRIVSNFLPKGSTVTSLVNPRTNRHEVEYVNTRYYSKIPMVLLVNRFSASASEITAGALQDYRRASLVGEKTYGKGSVQTIYELPDKGALKFTIAHYLTPSGKDIHLKGIKPDVECQAEPSNKLGGEDDVQLKVAVKELKRQLAKDDSKPAQQL